ncbi:MAG: peptidoglycan-binding protein [Jiangellaceae bacterium]
MSTELTKRADVEVQMPGGTVRAARRSRVWPALVGWIVGLALGFAAAGWAGGTLMRPPANALETPGYTLVEARVGDVAQSFRLNASALWAARSEIANQASGTVTSVELEDGQSVAPGDILYTVDLRPVVAAVGAVPAFRDMTRGDRGADIAQLQDLLGALGYYDGKSDGRFDSTTQRAVRAWQRDIGVASDGAVRRGDVVFVHELPSRLALDPELVVGATLAGGEATVLVLATEPSFTIALPDGQAQVVRPGMAVELVHGDEPWLAEIADITSGGADGESIANLSGVEGATICGDGCAAIPLGDPTLIPSVIHVVPETHGVTIPASALVTTAIGDIGVVLASGDLHTVTVIESASGLAVVEGLGAGERVRTPGELPTTPTAAPTP